MILNGAQMRKFANAWFFDSFNGAIVEICTCLLSDFSPIFENYLFCFCFVFLCITFHRTKPWNSNRRACDFDYLFTVLIPCFFLNQRSQTHVSSQRFASCKALKWESFFTISKYSLLNSTRDFLLDFFHSCEGLIDVNHLRSKTRFVEISISRDIVFVNTHGSLDVLTPTFKNKAIRMIINAPGD